MEKEMTKNEMRRKAKRLYWEGRWHEAIKLITKADNMS